MFWITPVFGKYFIVNALRKHIRITANRIEGVTELKFFDNQLALPTTCKSYVPKNFLQRFYTINCRCV